VVFVDVRFVAVKFTVILALSESSQMDDAATTFRITPSAAIKPVSRQCCCYWLRRSAILTAPVRPRWEDPDIRSNT
jgi:hypothetical protein